MGYASLAGGTALTDNDHMTNDPSKPFHRSRLRRMEYRLISMGMSVIAYLLEKVVLRSLKNGGAEP